MLSINQTFFLFELLLYARGEGQKQNKKGERCLRRVLQTSQLHTVNGHRYEPKRPSAWSKPTAGIWAFFVTFPSCFILEDETLIREAFTAGCWDNSLI